MDIYIIGILASILGLLVTIIYREKMRFKQLLFWIILWLSMAFFSIFPNGIDFLKNLFSVGYRAYFVFTFCIIGLLLINFYVFTQISKIHDQIAALAQEFALLRYEIESKEDSHESGRHHNGSQ